MTTRHTAPLRRRAITTPSSEGHASAVRIQRMHGHQPVREWAEGVPFRTLAELRSSSEQPTTSQPAPASEPEADDSAFDLRGKDYSDHHGPQSMSEYHRGRALFWRCYLGGLAVTVGLLAWWLMR